MSEFYVENMNLLARIGIMSTLVVTVEKLSIEELDSYHSEDELKTTKNGCALSTTCSKIIAQSTGVNFKKFNIYYLRNYFL